MVKRFLDKVIGIYEYHGKFYAFVHGLEGAAVAALVSYEGGVPTNKVEWYAFFAFVGKALYGFVKGYLIANSGNPGAGDSGNQK